MRWKRKIRRKKTTEWGEQVVEGLILLIVSAAEDVCDTEKLSLYCHLKITLALGGCGIEG